MSLNFLQIASTFGKSANPGLIGSSPNPGLGSALGLGALGIGLMLLMIFVILGIYIYLAIAYMRIGKKAGQQNPGVAWVFTPVISIFEISKMHWWPWPFLIFGYLIGYLIMMAGMAGFVAGAMTGNMLIGGGIFILGFIVLLITIIVFAVVSIMWQWKTYEAVKKPGWWAIVSPIISILGALVLLGSILIPMLSILAFIMFLIAGIVYLVFVGLAAWTD